MNLNRNIFHFCRTLLASCTHALLMSSWIFVFDRSPFCSTTIVHSILFSMVLGFVFVFNYILPKITDTRLRFTIYYTICFVENVTCVIVYNLYATPEEKSANYFLPLCILSILPFILGIGFMLLYYLRYHPNVVSRRRSHQTERRPSEPKESVNIQLNDIPSMWISILHLCLGRPFWQNLSIYVYIDTFIKYSCENKFL